MSVVIISQHPDFRHQDRNVATTSVVGAADTDAEAREKVEELVARHGSENVEFYLIDARKVVPVTTIENAE